MMADVWQLVAGSAGGQASSIAVQGLLTGRQDAATTTGAERKVLSAGREAPNSCLPTEIALLSCDCRSHPALAAHRPLARQLSPAALPTALRGAPRLPFKA